MLLESVRIANGRLGQHMYHVKVLLESVEIAKKESDNILNVKVMFDNVQIAKNVNNVKMCIKMCIMRMCSRSERSAMPTYVLNVKKSVHVVGFQTNENLT